VSGATSYEFAVTPELSVSFQRYPYPADGRVSALPRSCGALPLVEAAPRMIAVPSPPGEAFWVGLVRPPRRPRAAAHVVAVLRSGDRIELTRTAGSWLTGVPRADGTWWALARDPPLAGVPACSGLEVATPVGEGTVRVELVDPVRFTALAGVALETLDESRAYGGWRLP
jgi:hypothetical protein